MITMKASASPMMAAILVSPAPAGDVLAGCGACAKVGELSSTTKTDATITNVSTDLSMHVGLMTGASSSRLVCDKGPFSRRSDRTLVLGGGVVQYFFRLPIKTWAILVFRVE